MEFEETNLIKLKYAKEQEQIRTLEEKLSPYPKYFFTCPSINGQSVNVMIIYDKTELYILNKGEVKIFSLGKQYLITQLAYNLERDIVVFLTVEGQMFAHFLVSKTLLVLKKQVKRITFFDWVYGVPNIFQFFTTDETGIKLFKVDEEKKTFKEIKHLSGKYNSFLYEPLSETLLGFPVGDCKTVQPFIFSQNKYNNWFKMSPVGLDFSHDQYLVQKVRLHKALGLNWQAKNKELFLSQPDQRYHVQLIKINRKCYLLFFFAEEGLLKLIPTMYEQKDKEASIKLPSDAIPCFHVVDNMLAVHLKIEGITFIYDLNGNSLQPLVSPYPLRHEEKKDIKGLYEAAFVGERAIARDGSVSKWKVHLEVIFSYLKNEVQIFDFFIKRSGAKMLILQWLRRDLFKIKELNLSKFWKSLFLKYLSNAFPEQDVVNLIDLYSRVFYTLAQEQLIPKEKLLDIILQCIRQALELKMNIPFELQNLTLDLLLKFRKYQLLVFLTHNDIIKDSEEIIQKILNDYKNNHNGVLATLAVDMTHRSGTQKDMVRILMKLGRIRDAKKYIKQHYQKLEVLYLIQVAKYIQDQTISQDYLKYIKSFVLQKYPAMNVNYLNEAEQKVKPSNSWTSEPKIEVHSSLASGFSSNKGHPNSSDLL